MTTKPDWTFAPEDAPTQGIWLRRISGFLLILLCIDLLVILCAPLARLYLDVPALVAFRLFAPGLIAGLLLAVFALIITIIAMIKKQSFVVKRGLIIMLFGIMPTVTAVLSLGLEKIGKPPIHDISTDTIDPPEFIVARTLRSQNENSLDYAGEEIAKKQLAAYPNVQPIISTLSQEQALRKAADVVLQLNWTLTSMDNDAGTIEAYDKTRVFGFTDDVIIRVRAEGTGSRVDIRSVSRVGLSDLGKNAERIELFTRLFLL